MRAVAVLPLLAGLQLDAVDLHEDAVILTLRARRRTARCPRCGTRSAKVQSHYRRRVADVPSGNQRVLLHLQVRRFRCRHRRCDQSIFAERFPELVAPYGRRTHAQTALLAELGMAVGGAVGARLARGLRLPASRPTILCQRSP